MTVERQTRGYKRSDPATKHEKALPPIVFRHRLRHSISSRAIARAHLIAGALFFAMRSCEYLRVGPTEERKTRAIRVRDIVFRRNNRVVAHSDPDLAESDSVDVTFGDQKTEVKDETISQDNNDDPELNPVRNMAYTIQRLRSYPGFSPDWPIYKFFDGSTFSNITSKEVLIDIRASVAAIGFDRLGYSPDDVGTHSVRSVRSSFAMMLYLAREPIYTIMLLGRWSSNAFLAYIEKQVKEFTKGVSRRMLQHESFFNTPLPSTRPNSTPTNRRSRRRTLLSISFGHKGSLRHQLRLRS